jgi:hypothetical protein
VPLKVTNYNIKGIMDISNIIDRNMQDFAYKAESTGIILIYNAILAHRNLPQVDYNELLQESNSGEILLSIKNNVINKLQPLTNVECNILREILDHYKKTLLKLEDETPCHPDDRFCNMLTKISQQVTLSTGVSLIEELLLQKNN